MQTQSTARPKAHRSSQRAPLDIYLNKFLNGVPYLVRAKDISEEGIYLTQLIEPDWAERRVGLQFQLPGLPDLIYAEGEIARDAHKGRATGQGIRFTLVSPRHRRLISAYVQKHGKPAA